ncbi:hypothetical protein [Trichocoleus desertorum]|uniref:Uncharacterized protein n=1 Tax=Trichocoleus desertorum GB2-A4 TaxID=2933944 RepID=A0ABV0JIC2_9CYAN
MSVVAINELTATTDTDVTLLAPSLTILNGCEWIDISGGHTLKHFEFNSG